MNLLRRTSWDALHAFAEFAETRNFTRAAERLGISQPALHTKVANLGVALGAALYVRHGRQIEITEAGRRAQRFAREVAHAASEFEAELGTTNRKASVVLAAGEGAFLYLLGPALRDFRSAHRHPLQLETASANQALEAVSGARAHLGVAALDRVPRHLVVEPLTRIGHVLAVPARHELAGHRPARLKDLHGANLVLPPEGRPHRAMIARALQSASVAWQPAVEANGWELMLHFVRLGIGVAIVNACCKIPAGVVVRPLPELPPVQFHLFHAKKSLPPRANDLKAALLRHADAWKTGSNG